ncbi:hypothetical protein TanjilG_22841 [Lupinus angustifolius]|uniref:Uncharacterized protein n=1 Tax=Lupinus angustifolius TaxID=3871 RepID=A0A4P1RHQ5_LUPAN|nr:hypothetical protein TanjilG_22841 [Lupinus angustifolius]
MNPEATFNPRNKTVVASFRVLALYFLVTIFYFDFECLVCCTFLVTSGTVEFGWVVVVVDRWLPSKAEARSISLFNQRFRLCKKYTKIVNQE